jgi:RNA polymerase sigma factor (sigma-70 family)
MSRCFALVLSWESNVLNRAELAELVAAVAVHRDRTAFTRLFDFFTPRLEAYLIRLGTTVGMAEEISQDVMITLWRKAELFDPEKSSVTTWIYRIARNRRIDAARRDRMDYVDPMDSAFDGIADDTELDLVVDLQQREEALRVAIKDLPDEQLTLVKMAFFESMSHSAIAEMTGLPLGTVKSRIRLAFNRLKRSLETVGVVEAT